VRRCICKRPRRPTAVRDRLGTALLQQLDGAIDFDEYRDYNDALRQLFFNSLTPEDAAAQMAGARVFPWADPGLIHALWNRRFYYDECELHDDGKVHIGYWINIAAMGIRTETVQLDPFDMIAVRFEYPEEYAGAEVGQTIYMPAINLRSLHRNQFKGELQTAVDVGLIAAGGAGLAGAGTRLARVIAALDLAVGVADVTIRDFRHDIARLEHGRDFLAAWDVVSTLIAAYGVTRLALQGGAALNRLRRAFDRFRGARPALPAGAMQRIESEVDDVLRQADEAEEAAAASGQARTSGADDADAATGQPSTNSTDAVSTTGGGARGLIGVEFEAWLQRHLGGSGSFKVAGREFDGAVGSRWIEAKSGRYWERFAQPGPGFDKFKSDMGQRLRIARDHGASLEVHSNTPIPDHVKSWLSARGMQFFEHLGG
jgi:hypothetical protein